LVEESNQSSFVFDLIFIRTYFAIGVVVVVVVVAVLQSQGKEEDESYL